MKTLKTFSILGSELGGEDNTDNNHSSNYYQQLLGTKYVLCTVLRVVKVFPHWVLILGIVETVTFPFIVEKTEFQSH